MLFLTHKGIAERYARGWEEASLYSEPNPERIARAKEIIDQITLAFQGILLGRGVGLHEGQAIDDYATEKERAYKRSLDEKENWAHIPAESLNAYYSSLTFFDAAGMRFHLPAFLTCDLRGEFDSDSIEYSVVNLSDHSRQTISGSAYQ